MKLIKVFDAQLKQTTAALTADRLEHCYFFFAAVTFNNLQ